MDEDPAFYEKFSKLIQQAIEDFRAKRLSDMDYLKKVMEIRTKVVTRRHDGMPEKLSGNENAMAYFGVLKPFFANLAPEVSESLTADTALAIDSILERHWKVQFWDDDDAKNLAINDIDDYLFDEVKGKMGVEMSEEQMDALIERPCRWPRAGAADEFIPRQLPMARKISNSAFSMWTGRHWKSPFTPTGR